MRTNVATPKAPAPLTHEGAAAARINSVQQLRRTVMACMLFEDGFYESGVEVAQRITEEVANVLKLSAGADIVANIAYEARTKFKLRHAPLWLTVALIEAQTSPARAVVGGVIAAVVQRPDELAELVAMYWKDGKKAITAQMRKGIQAAFRKFDRYQLSKYANRDGKIQMRDVLFLAHCKPESEEQAQLWKELANKQLKAPDTWEANLSAGAEKKETFTRLIQEGKLGALALLRNLRGMTEAGVDMDLIRGAMRDMRTERVLPFRFITAARYAPALEPELEEAMFRCVAAHPKLAGTTAICVDISYSMESKVSGKSEISRRDAAAALAMLLREICDNVHIIAFATTAGLVPPRRGFGLNDAIGNGRFGSGTNIGEAVRIANGLGYDRCIVITDEQTATAPGRPLPGATGYFINVASNHNGVGYGEWVHIDGWSEAVVDYIQQYEASRTEGAEDSEGA